MRIINMKFDMLCEKYKLYKQVKREFYPRQINFTPDFLKALRAEYENQQVDEDNHPINNKRAKFVKALNFHLRDIDNGVVNEDTTSKVARKKIPRVIKKNLRNK